jgi:hypothetical protein
MKIEKHKLIAEMELSSPLLQEGKWSAMAEADQQAEIIVGRLEYERDEPDPEARICKMMTGLWSDPRVGGFCLKDPLKPTEPKPDGRSLHERALTELARWFAARYRGYTPLGLEREDRSDLRTVRVMFRREARAFMRSEDPAKTIIVP